MASASRIRESQFKRAITALHQKGSGVYAAGGCDVIEKTLRKYGWQPIVSDAQAAQLLRRELKHHASWQQRCPGRDWDYRNLLAIKRGNWFKFMRNNTNGYCSILIRRMPLG